jgi:predicted extracellular nuclease
MFKEILNAPLYAAFFFTLILPGCSDNQFDPQASRPQCPKGTTPIASVQGSAAESPIIGQQVTVQGVVTLVQRDRGLYIEEPESDDNERTSNAVFVRHSDFSADLKEGDLVSVRGTVSELETGRYPTTAITAIENLTKCAHAKALPLTDVSLPLNGLGREALEGMRIQVSTALVVTDVYRFGQGDFTLSGNGPQFFATETAAPGPDAAKIIAQNRAFSLPAMLTEGTQAPVLLVSGTPVESIIGVVAHDKRSLRVALQSIAFTPPADFAPPRRAANDALRIVGMNLHNYFNGDGKGQGFPAPRGAENMDGFRRQRDRISAAIKVLDPHVLAVIELENDGFGPYSAAQDFIRLANNATRKTWAVTRPADDNTGGDEITVGLFYRTDRLKAIGAARTLTGAEFLHSRQPQAQLFQQLDGGPTVLVVINHLKSKGSCPDSGENADQKDGQGCWNPMRLSAAKKMSAWAKNIATAAATDNILILGDMNAYRNEDPITAVRNAGFTELMDGRQEQPYSYVYFGQHGTLDYAFASPALLEKSPEAFIWNVNAALPANVDLPRPWLRFSDHDPVVVDIRLRHSSTSD